MSRLYDGQGNVVTEWNPRFEALRREIQFSSGYNTRPERRGSSGGMFQNAGSETWARNRDRLKSMWDARDSAKFDWIGGVLGRVGLYVAGRLHCKSDTGDGEADTIYDEYFHNWCGDERGEDGLTQCDITGRHRLIKMLQMAFMSFLVDGDYGLVEVAPQFSPTGKFCLQGIEADRIGSPLEAVNSESYIGGVTIDPSNGRVISFRVFRRTRTNQYIEPQEIPAESFLHVFDPDRSDEYRGQTHLLRCLNSLRDIREWSQAEMIAGKSQSLPVGMIGTKDPFNNNGPSAFTGQTPTGTPTQDAVYGKWYKMAEGENFNMLAPPNRPSGGFMAFVETEIRKVAHALKLSFGMVWDLAQLGGVSQRLEVQADLRRIQYWQKNILENLILNRVRQKVLAEGIMLGMIPATPGWKQCSWSWGPFLTADLGHEADADVLMLSHGIGDVDEVISKHTGKSAAELAKSNAATANKFIAAGTESELPVEAFAAGQYPDITNQKAAYLTPSPIPPPPPGSLEIITDKGAGKLIDILEKVGDGTIDRESAVNTVMMIFSLTRAKAEKIIPEPPSEADLNRAAGLDSKGRHAPVSSNGKSNGKKPR